MTTDIAPEQTDFRKVISDRLLLVRDEYLLAANAANASVANNGE